MRDAEEALAVTHTRAATDLVALYKALGGGWDAAAGSDNLETDVISSFE